MPSIEPSRLEELTRIAKRVRVEVVRNVHGAKGGHIGGSLSAAELMIALYFEVLNIDPSNPGWEERDRFILSKGHASICLYAVLASRGYFPMEELATFDACNSRMQAHPCMKTTPGIDMSTGSLGQGLSPGVGMAMGAKLLGADFRTYVMIGDGEAQEGQIWEAAMYASHLGLGNLTAIMDYNKVQLYGWQHPSPMVPVTDPATKFKAFGWETIEIDGHDFQAIIDACGQAAGIKDRPTMIIAHTVKAKGVSFMEHRYQWHAGVPNDDQCRQALDELEACS